MTLGKRLQEKRVALEMTQQEIAAQLNVSRPTISNWETGRSYPDIDSLIVLSELLDVTIDSLLKGDVVVVKKMNKDMKKGKYLNWLVMISLLLIISFSLAGAWMAYKAYNRYIVSGNQVKTIKLSTGQQLSRKTVIDGTIPKAKFESGVLATYDIYEDTLYLMIYAEPALKSDNHFSMKFAKSDPIDQIEKIVVTSFDLKEVDGYAFEDLALFPQKIIWQKE